MKKHNFVKACVALAAAVALAPVVNAAPEKVDTKMCTACHANIGGFHKSGAHKDVSCTSCHSGLTKHLRAPGHPAQFKSMYKVNEERTPRYSKKNSDSVAPNPFFDRALAPTALPRNTICRAATRSPRLTSTSSTAPSAAASSPRKAGCIWA